jgi:hypothetical protein
VVPIVEGAAQTALRYVRWAFCSLCRTLSQSDKAITRAPFRLAITRTSKRSSGEAISAPLARLTRERASAQASGGSDMAPLPLWAAVALAGVMGVLNIICIRMGAHRFYTVSGAPLDPFAALVPRSATYHAA